MEGKFRYVVTDRADVNQTSTTNQASTTNQTTTRHDWQPEQSNSHPYANVDIQTAPQSKKRSWKNVWRAGAGLLAIAILLAVTIPLVTKNNTSDNIQEGQNSEQPTSDPTTFTTFDTCLDLVHQGVTTSGIKSLKAHGTSKELREVYCDMDTDGGGWTLVASIHEDDVNAKCTHEDRWSTYIKDWSSHYTGKTNWENKVTFGQLRDCLRDDYKTDGYYKINASDVMIWHIRNEQEVDALKSGAILKYRTDNQFLQSYGGNLKNLFSEYMPIAKNNADYKAQTLYAVSQKLTVKNLVYDWYDYNMIPDTYYISDTGMFSSNGGNRIYFRSSRNGYTRYYGRNQTWPCLSTIFSTSTSPSMLLVLVRNDLKYTSYYQIEEVSYRVYYEYGKSTGFSGKRQLGDFEIYYRGIQLYESSRRLKTECRFNFYVSNTKAWNSKHPSGISENSKYFNYYGYRRVYYQIDGYPARVLFGNILLSRQNGNIYGTSELDAVADSILKTISTFPYNLMTAQSDTDSVTVPVTFDKGSIDDLNEKIPTEMRSQVQSGHLQFRAYNLDGYANALCPGIRVTGIQPEYVCVGGISNDISPYGTCGDFAGWFGVEGNLPLLTKPSTYGHSFNDIHSSLLIFYR